MCDVKFSFYSNIFLCSLFISLFIDYCMINKSKKRQFNEFAGFAIDIIKECKLKVILISAIMIIALLTGIIVAARTHSTYLGIENYGIVDVRTGTLTTTFFSRLLSMLFIALIMFGCSFSVYLMPIAVLFLAYRAYLLGLNICLMIIFYGFSGVVVSIVVAFPIQLIALATLLLFYILMSKTCKDYKSFGGCKVPKQKSRLILSAVIILFLLCIIESLFVVMFSAKVILVI